MSAKDAAIAAIKGYIDSRFAAVVKRVDDLYGVFVSVPRPKDGENGKDGKDCDVAFLREIVAGEVAKAVAVIPKAIDGVNGINGTDGTSVDADEIELIAQDAVAKAFAALPIPQGRDGRDAVSIPGDNGKDGKDGLDGFSLDDFDVESKDDGRIILFKLKSRDREIVREIRTAMIIDRGVYKSGTAHAKGDSVTYGGSMWIAQRETTGAPGDGSPDWRLSVKRGRDAKDAA